MARKLGSWVLALALGALVLGIGLAGARTTASTSLLVQVLGRGTVTASGGQINCGNGANKCFFEAGSEATITLTATPTSGWTFGGWDSGSDDCSGSTNPCTFTLNVGDEDENISVFTTSPAPGTSTLTVNVTGDSSNQGGTVEADNDQINCDPGETDCTLDVTTGSTITLVQTPQSGYDFAGWGGPCSGTGRSCTVEMSSDQTVNASFVTGASSHTLTVSVTGNGTVTGSGISCTSAGGSGCTATVAANASVTLSATAGSGAGFTAWGGACSGTTPTCTFTMTSDMTVTAAFTGTGGGGGGGGTTFPLTVSVTGTGRVTGGGIDCGDGNTTCSVNLASGTTVTLTAAASGDADFKGWGGACSGTNKSCTVTMTAARSVTATFAKPASPTAVTLTLRVEGKGTVSASGGTCASSGKTTTCNQSYDSGTEVTLTATPQAGATFTAWSGACSGTELTCTITLDQAATVTAAFSGARVPAHAGAALRSRGRPIVHHTRSGFRVTLRFTTSQRGVAHVRALRAGRVQTALTFTIASGPATIGPFPVTKPGFYRFELTVGTRRLHWTACLGRCGAAAHAAPFVVTRGPARVLDAGALWLVSVRFHATLPSGAVVRIYRDSRLVRALRFPLATGDVSAGPFLLSPGTYRVRLTATDAYGRTRSLRWYALLP